MQQLRKFPAEDRSLVNESFFRGESSINEADLSRVPPSIGVEVEMRDLQSLLDDIVKGKREYESHHHVEADVAPILHRTVNISRRQASDPEIWHWLAIMWHPEFVRHRWPYDTGDRTFTSMREKFLGGGSDIYSNAFGRIWWMAELAYDEEAKDPYHLTREILKYQFLANRLLDPAFARYQPAVIAFGERLLNEHSEVIRHANRRFNQALSVIQLESRDTDELREIVSDVVKGVKEDYEMS